MDFIELPDGVLPEEVPDLGGPEYDNGDFLTYPQRQGWNLDALLDLDFPAAYNGWDSLAISYEADLEEAYNGWDVSALIGRDFAEAHRERDQITESSPLGAEPDELPRKIGADLLRTNVGGFIQTWILLGILNVGLRRPVLRQEVSSLREAIGANGKTIQTKFITIQHSFMECAANLRDHLETDSEWYTHLTDCLRVAIAFLQALEDCLPAALHRIILPWPVEISLVTLLNTLDLHQNFHSEQYTRVSLSSCTALEREMLERRGWCPSVIHRLRFVGGAQSIYYASFLPTPESGEGHDKCDDDICFAFNIDQATYSVMHTADCLCLDDGCKHRHCACHCLEIPYEELSDALDAGGYPLVRFREGKAEFVRYQPGMQYVAISHVWSDGRGNPSSNALPACQLESIRRWVSDLAEGDTLFWVDTLCVPISEPLRNTAIMRMAQTYEAAVHVLVLSRELLECDLPQSRLQTLYMVFCSKWMTRLWTMQEAALAKKLMFQFRDRAIEYNTLVDEVMASSQVPMVNDSAQSRIAGLSMILHMNIFNMSMWTTEKYGAKKFSLTDLLWAWRDRTSSRLTDATICASILLRTDLSRILAVPDDMKMATFWACQSTVPVGTLFALGPRLDVVGFRWAPRNLLDPLTRRTFAGGRHNEKATATVVTGGLMISGLKAVLLGRATLTHIQTSDAESYFWFRVPDASRPIKFLFEEEQSSVCKSLMSGDCLLLMDEYKYEPEYKRACLTVLSEPTGNVIAKDGDDTPVPAQYLVYGGVSFEEDEDLSTDEHFDRLVVPVANVFGPSRRWLIS